MMVTAMFGFSTHNVTEDGEGNTISQLRLLFSAFCLQVPPSSQ
jgi:hypothetical protein